jgi:predicted Zn-dependent protease
MERALELARLAVPPGTRSYRDLLWLGRLLDGAGRAVEAERQLRGAIALAPEAAEPWLALARVQRRDLRPDEANRTLAQMADKVAEARRGVAVARGHELMGRFEDAEASLRAFLKDDPRDAEAQRRLANLLLRLDRPADAEPVLVGLLSKGTRALPEERPELRRQLALAVTAPGRPPRADLALSLLRLNAGTEADRRTEALVRGSAPAGRAEALRALAALPAGPPEEMLRWAQLQDTSGNWPRAREMMLELAAADPDNPAFAAELADGLLRHNRRPEARSWLEKLEKLAPADPRLPALRKQLEVE